MLQLRNDEVYLFGVRTPFRLRQQPEGTALLEEIDQGFIEHPLPQQWYRTRNYSDCEQLATVVLNIVFKKERTNNGEKTERGDRSGVDGYSNGDDAIRSSEEAPGIAINTEPSAETAETQTNLSLLWQGCAEAGGNLTVHVVQYVDQYTQSHRVAAKGFFSEKIANVYAKKLTKGQAWPVHVVPDIPTHN